MHDLDRCVYLLMGCDDGRKPDWKEEWRLTRFRYRLQSGLDLLCWLQKKGFFVYDDNQPLGTLKYLAVRRWLGV
jgi:hypothetical protein